MIGPVKVAAVSLPSNGDNILPGISGKGYLIKMVNVCAEGKAGTTIAAVSVRGTNAYDGNTLTFCKVAVVPNAANAENVVMPCEVNLKPGFPVSINLYDINGGVVASSGADGMLLTVLVHYIEME